MVHFIDLSGCENITDLDIVKTSQTLIARIYICPAVPSAHLAV